MSEQHHNEKDRCGSDLMRRKQTGCLLVFRQRFTGLGQVGVFMQSTCSRLLPNG